MKNYVNSFNHWKAINEQSGASVDISSDLSRIKDSINSLKSPLEIKLGVLSKPDMRKTIEDMVNVGENPASYNTEVRGKTFNDDNHGGEHTIIGVFRLKHNDMYAFTEMSYVNGEDAYRIVGFNNTRYSVAQHTFLPLKNFDYKFDTLKEATDAILTLYTNFLNTLNWRL